MTDDRCTLGVGCDEYGMCYADTRGRPDMCGKPMTENRKARIVVKHYGNHIWRLWESAGRPKYIQLAMPIDPPDVIPEPVPVNMTYDVITLEIRNINGTLTAWHNGERV